MFSIPTGRVLVAGVIIALISIGLLPKSDLTPIADMQVEATNQTPTVNNPFTVEIIVTSTEPVNVFKGTLVFDPNVLKIEAIDYNTSIADLWAERPWYSNGEGTLNFIGGTTRPGGHTGKDQIIKVTFIPKVIGETIITMEEVVILRHDGLGTEVTVEKPIDRIFEITAEDRSGETLADKPIEQGPTIYITPEKKSTDLNGDGKQTLSDTSIFMAHLATQNLRSDFNNDGAVNLKDLSILNK